MCRVPSASAARRPLIYARHRISYDTDHVLPTLRDSFEEVLSALEAHTEWQTALNSDSATTFLTSLPVTAPPPAFSTAVFHAAMALSLPSPSNGRHLCFVGGSRDVPNWGQSLNYSCCTD